MEIYYYAIFIVIILVCFILLITRNLNNKIKNDNIKINYHESEIELEENSSINEDAKKDVEEYFIEKDLDGYMRQHLN